MLMYNDILFGVSASEGLNAEGQVDIGRIVVMCGVMYSTIGAMWLGYLSMQGTKSEIFKIALLCISWSSMSIGMITLNKALVTALQAPAIISMVQMLITAAVMAPSAWAPFFQIPGKQLLTWMIVPFFFAGMLCSSFYTFEYISISLLTIVRNLSPMVAMPIERAIMDPDKRPKLAIMTYVSIFIMLGGALVYGEGVHGVSVIGISFAVLNMMMAVGDRVLQRRLLTQDCKDMPSSVCTTINNFAGMFPTLLIAYATNQVGAAIKNRADWMAPSMMFLLVLSGFVGLGICYLGFETQRCISATSFFVLQNATKMVTVAIGVLVFGDPVTMLTMTGVALSAGGSYLYGHTQMQMAREAQQSGEGKPLLNKKESA